ncbi:hypothetical protein BDW62DRAFT_194929 [Aspergillus aurantiobrunneus]
MASASSPTTSSLSVCMASSSHWATATAFAFSMARTASREDTPSKSPTERLGPARVVAPSPSWKKTGACAAWFCGRVDGILLPFCFR